MEFQEAIDVITEQLTKLYAEQGEEYDHERERLVDALELAAVCIKYKMYMG